MTIAWFCLFECEQATAALSAKDLHRAIRVVDECPGLGLGNVYTPAESHDPYTSDGRGPALVIELQFNTLAACEANLHFDGYLQRLTEPELFPSLGATALAQQAMLARHYVVAQPSARSDQDMLRQPLCTFLVHYPGPAEDTRAWHAHYVRHHPSIMTTFPEIRDVAVYTPAIVVSGITIRELGTMQRNKVVFDSPPALDRALASPVRETMRRDFEAFPPFHGGNRHFAMHTYVRRPNG